MHLCCMSMPMCVFAYAVFTCACLCVNEVYCVWLWEMTCLIAWVCLAPSNKSSHHLQTPLSPTSRSRRRKRRAWAKPRLLRRRAVWRYLSVNSPYAACHPLLFSSPSMYFCLTTWSPCVQVPKRIEVHSIHTYVALYKFLPQEQNDLELQWVKAKPTAYMQPFL